MLDERQKERERERERMWVGERVSREFDFLPHQLFLSLINFSTENKL